MSYNNIMYFELTNIVSSCFTVAVMMMMVISK